MHAYLLKFLQDLRASYWFIPSCMMLAALVLSFVLQWWDGILGGNWLDDIAWLVPTSAEGARSILTVIAGSVIGVAGVTFSITMVAVSFASANIGPRLIENFMRDRGNQVTLGTFIGTFVYCLMVLRTVHGAMPQGAGGPLDAYVPHLSVFVALCLALASISVLIYFIHHVPETINVGKIAAKIGGELTTGIQNLFPDIEKLEPEADADAQLWEESSGDRRHAQVYADCDGYIQTLDEARLGEIARNEGLLVRVQYRPGDFVGRHNAVLDIYSVETLADEARAKLQACYAIGDHRTAHQNVLFVVDQLVEIIVRALSPGINDPFTAILCFDWLKIGIVRFARDEKPARGPNVSARVKIYPIGFARFVSAIFDQTRQYVCKDRNVSLHVLALLTETAALLEPGPRRDILIVHLQKLADACAEKLADREGGHDIAAMVKGAMQRLSNPNGYEDYRCSEEWFGGR